VFLVYIELIHQFSQSLTLDNMGAEIPECEMWIQLAVVVTKLLPEPVLKREVDVAGPAFITSPIVSS
jgi:hypothetical protein